MRKCIIISDSFKGTLSSMEICEIARSSIPKFFPECEIVTVPVADGGEGTVACFAAALNAQTVTVTVSGPYGEPVAAAYVRSGEKAVIEMAATAGLPLVGERKDPERTSTYGVGELIAHAVRGGAKEILLGLGGSATNDGGCGCAAALGVRFLDENGAEFIPTGGTLERIADIDIAPAQKLLQGVRVTAMCDVDNPLTGPRGAAAVFAPQKGADAGEKLRNGQAVFPAQVFPLKGGKGQKQLPGKCRGKRPILRAGHAVGEDDAAPGTKLLGRPELPPVAAENVVCIGHGVHFLSAPVYAFFRETVKISCQDGRRAL